MLMWWMLARLVNRRLAWLALLVVGSCPFFCLVARQGMPDMPLVACVMGAIAMFTMAVEDGDRPIDARVHDPAAGAAGCRRSRATCCSRSSAAFIAVQAIYYADVLHRVAAARDPRLPAARSIVLPLLMARARRPCMWHERWRTRARASRAVATRSRALVFPIAWAAGEAGATTERDRAIACSAWRRSRRCARSTCLWCYALLGVSVLAKGPPGLAVVGARRHRSTCCCSAAGARSTRASSSSSAACC